MATLFFFVSFFLNIFLPGGDELKSLSSENSSLEKSPSDDDRVLFGTKSSSWTHFDSVFDGVCLSVGLLGPWDSSNAFTMALL